MSESKLCRCHGKWVAMYGTQTKELQTMKEAAQWLDECAEKERKNERTDR